MADGGNTSKSCSRSSVDSADVPSNEDSLEDDFAEQEVLTSDSSPEAPCTISVATSTADLRRSDSSDKDVAERWCIHENILCREEAEGRSRSISPYTAEKKSYADKEKSDSAIIPSLDEEVGQ